MGKGFRCFSYALIGIALMLVSVQTAWAHVDPAGATGSGVSISLTAFRNDGTTPVLPGHIFQCETIIYRATLAYAGTVNGVVNGAIEGGTLTITTPDAVAHNVTPAGGIPCLGGTFNDPNHPLTGQCFGAPTAINSNTVSYTGSACVATASASVTYANGIAHIAVDDLTGVGAVTPLNITVDCCPSDNNACNGLEFCNPAKTYSVSGGTNNALGTCDVGPAPPPCVANACNTAACDPATGNCVQTPVADSTACTDTDSNNCTAAGCEAGSCVQTHVTTPCTPTNECNTAACDATHTCVQTPKSDSTACTDTDGNNCTAAGCEAGSCVQTHVTTPCTALNECNTAACDATHTCVQTPVGDSTACTDTDGNDCTTAGCEAGVCAQAHVTTPCTPTNECNTAACDATHTCVQTAKSDSTACTDTDGNACTTAGCEAGLCVQAHITDTTCGVEICRTPGFWGTHGGIEKNGSTNITQTVLNECPGLTICGALINTTDLTCHSAVEAICVSPKGDSTLQLARQLTAAALNCIVSKSSACLGGGQTCGAGQDVCSGVADVDAFFSACNDACALGNTTVGSLNCIEALDCFNNGGIIDANGECSGSSGCHDRELVNGCFNFNPPGPAGSPKECNDARKDTITIQDCQP